MQKYVKNEKRYRLINFICLLAVYKKLIGTGRVLSTRILRYVSSNFSSAQPVPVLGNADLQYNHSLHRQNVQHISYRVILFVR